MKRCFTHVVEYLDLGDGDIYVLPGEDTLRVIETQVAEMGAELAKKEAELTELAANAPKAGKNEPKEEAPEVAAMRQAVAETRERIEATRAQVANLRELPKKHADILKKHVFELHRMGWYEREEIREECTITDPDTQERRLDMKQFKRLVLTRCLESWDYDEPITEQAVAELDRPIFASLYANLWERLEVSADRLAFLGITVVGHS